ncbi:MAG: ShlB/FhaC/HecB family hemolysin secretion/activation protein [Selenomonadaceae bacterium]|nr:ShlB/FhaC/HecB family hemolysin secretion/activation protein [Selenomonadaceae bacterium]
MKSKFSTGVIIFSAVYCFFASTANAEDVNTADISREAARQAAGDDEKKVIENVEVDTRDIDKPETENIPEETFNLKGIIIDSDIEDIDQSSVQHIIDPYINQQVDINQLRDLALKIKYYCRTKGWLAAVAYIPEQDSTDGTVRIKIMSPNFGKVIFDNESHIADDILQKVGENISQNHMVENDKIENVLYLINEIGGIQARGALIPDTATQRINLNINVIDDKTKRGIFYLENYGSKYSGRYRAGIIYDIYNIDNRGSRFEVSGLLSSKKSALGQLFDKNLDNYSFDYSWITDRKTTSRLGFSFGRTTYHQHGLNSDLIKDSGGHSIDLQIHGTTPVWKTIHDGFTWNYGYKFRKVTSSVDYDFSSYGIMVELFPELFPTHNQNESYVHTATLGVSGYNRSLFNDLFNYSFTIYGGYNSPRTESARELAELTGSEGHFFKSQLVLDYRKLFSKACEFHTNLTFQNASRGLNSSEQMQIGGATGVRGYADGDGAGDEGYLTKTEFIWHTDEPGLSLSAFLDIGGAGYKIEHDIHTIKSWGIELNYAKPDDYFVKLDYARKIGNNLQVASDDKKQRFWFMVGKIF